MKSHPTWVRGLKLFLVVIISKIYIVAPHVGAWIETTYSLGSYTLAEVAPHVGAWIETRLR